MVVRTKQAEGPVKRPLQPRPSAAAEADKGNVRRREASRSQMRTFFDNSPDWLTLFRATKDGRFVYEDLNRATEHAYGLTRDQVIGRPLVLSAPTAAHSRQSRTTAS